MGAGPFHREEDPEPVSDVNVVPLADVSLVLLIILMVLSPMMTQSMLKLKTAAQPSVPPRLEQVLPPQQPEMILVVTMQAQGMSVGERYFQGMGAFLPYVTEELARRQDKKVFLVPHPDAPNGRVVNLLEMLRQCGADSVALVQTVPEDGAPPAVQRPEAGR